MNETTCLSREDRIAVMVRSLDAATAKTFELEALARKLENDMAILRFEIRNAQYYIDSLGKTGGNE